MGIELCQESDKGREPENFRAMLPKNPTQLMWETALESAQNRVNELSRQLAEARDLAFQRSHQIQDLRAALAKARGK